jgi:predicted O-linked N-acetylglucosamine transferase (SPINDLY family)
VNPPPLRPEPHDVVQLQEAVRQNPESADAYVDLARTLTRDGRWTEAVVCLRQAARLKPDRADICRRLGDALYWRPNGSLDEAIESYQQATRLDSGDAGAFDKLGGALIDAGRRDDAIAAIRRACELRPDAAQFHSTLLWCLHFHPSSDPQFLAREHERWNIQHAAPLAPAIQPHNNDPYAERRLRVGYVSPNFYNHSVGRFLAPLFEAHDHERFEIICYSSVRRPDQLTASLRRSVDSWHDVHGMDAESLANRIRDDRIDVLVELDLHSGGNHLLTFARKPAPVQVSYLGYCSTTGVRVIDYRLTDPFLDPPGDERFYAEESVRLPETYWCYQPHKQLPAVGPLPAIDRGHVTFGCLNNFCKATEPTLLVWRELLRRVEGSKLLIHARPGAHRERVWEFFAEKDVARARIEFADQSPMLDYFKLYHQIDIALDPFPFGGGTTTCDALWMGVPVISLAGETAVGRGGLSILSNVDLSELVARSPEEYIGIAQACATDLPRLAALRAELRERMCRSPLMDGQRFAGHVEAAYREMWRRWCAAQNLELRT